MQGTFYLKVCLCRTWGRPCFVRTKQYDSGGLGPFTQDLWGSWVKTTNNHLSLLCDFVVLVFNSLRKAAVLSSDKITAFSPLC